MGNLLSGALRQESRAIVPLRKARECVRFSRISPPSDTRTRLGPGQEREETRPLCQRGLRHARTDSPAQTRRSSRRDSKPARRGRSRAEHPALQRTAGPSKHVNAGTHCEATEVVWGISTLSKWSPPSSPPTQAHLRETGSIAHVGVMIGTEASRRRFERKRERCCRGSEPVASTPTAVYRREVLAARHSTDTDNGAAHIVYRISVTDTGCRFHRTLEFRSKRWPWRALDSTLTRWILGRQSSRALGDLEQVVEC
jgi:hypothetical protein